MAKVAASVATPDKETLDLIAQWNKIQKEAALLVGTEQALRAQIAQKLFAEHPKGTVRADLPNNYKLKCVKKLNFTLDSDKTKEFMNAAYATNDPAKKLLADRLVKWKPELSIKEYDDLPEDMVKMISPALTIKPGMPTLEIEAPKATEAT